MCFVWEKSLKRVGKSLFTKCDFLPFSTQCSSQSYFNKYFTFEDVKIIFRGRIKRGKKQRKIFQYAKMHYIYIWSVMSVVQILMVGEMYEIRYPDIQFSPSWVDVHCLNVK